MLKLNKKGFTVVELVIVIAVVAILAAVLIPTFLTLVQTANVSADIQLVTNLNKIMAMQDALDGRNATMHDALADAAANGYDVTRLTPTSNGNDIVWDQSADRFALVQKAESGSVEILYSKEKEDKKEYAANEVHTLWKIYDEVPAPDEQSYSVYYNGFAELATVEVKVGFDVGENYSASQINYRRDDNAATQNVIIRTNGADLSVSAPKDDVKHYGIVKKLTILAVNNEHCYHEFGTIVELISMGSGKFIAESTAVFVQSKDDIESVLNGKSSEFIEGVQFAQISPIAEVVSASNFVSAISKGGHFTISENAEINETITIFEGKEVIIDLKGNKITSKSGSYAIVIEKNAKLTIKNGDFSNAGNLSNASLIDNFGILVVEDGSFTSYGASIIKNERNASLTINGGTLTYARKADESGSSNPAAIINYSNVWINGGIIETSANTALNNVDYTDSETGVETIANAYISGGLLTGSEYSISHDGQGELKISGGTFDAGIFAAGYAEISGGVFNGEVKAKSISGGVFNDPSVIVACGQVTGGRFNVNTLWQIRGVLLDGKSRRAVAEGYCYIVDLEKGYGYVSNKAPSEEENITAVFDRDFYFIGEGGATLAATQLPNVAAEKYCREFVVYEDLTITWKNKKMQFVTVIFGKEGITCTIVNDLPERLKAKYKVEETVDENNSQRHVYHLVKTA